MEPMLTEFALPHSLVPIHSQPFRTLFAAFRAPGFTDYVNGHQ